MKGNERDAAIRGRLPAPLPSLTRAAGGVILALSMLVAIGCAGVRLETGLELHTDARRGPGAGPPQAVSIPRAGEPSSVVFRSESPYAEARVLRRRPSRRSARGGAVIAKVPDAKPRSDDELPETDKERAS